MHQQPDSKAKAKAQDGPTPLGAGLWAGLHAAGMALLLALAIGAARAETDLAISATDAFAAHCFRPTLTADLAATQLAVPGARVDFYDLNPFRDVAASPALGRPATPGTDRRCEVAFDGDCADMATQAALDALEAERIHTQAPLPDTHTNASLAGTRLLAARQLNPTRVAVVHVGTRPGPNGIETFLNVERLWPSDTLN